MCAAGSISVQTAPMYTAQSFSPRTFGKSTEKTHEEHRKLYGGYVKNASSLLEKIAAYKGDESKSYELGELYRRFSFEFNGMRNHECYFALLEGAATSLTPESSLGVQMIKQWGSIEAYKLAHLSLATTTRGIGWAMLSADPCDGSLLLHWVDEQHLGQLQGTASIVAIDMWEHAYVSDYAPSEKKEYVADFFSAINWSIAETRYKALIKK